MTGEVLDVNLLGNRKTYICWGNNIIAEIATKWRLAFNLGLASMSHNDIRVKAQSCVHNNLARSLSHDSWQPSRLSRIHEEENSIMLLDELCQFLIVSSRLRLVCKGMSKHRN